MVCRVQIVPPQRRCSRCEFVLLKIYIRGDVHGKKGKSPSYELLLRAFGSKFGILGGFFSEHTEVSVRQRAGTL